MFLGERPAPRVLPTGSHPSRYPLPNRARKRLGGGFGQLIIPVILCGGAGTRLWPVSRSDAPKPFLPLVDGQSTFALTLKRLAGRPLFGPIVVVANVAHRHLVEDVLERAGAGATLLLEPAGRDTAPAITAAAAFIAEADPFATLLVLPADHLIRDAAAFVATVEAALPAADAGRIVAFGITPTRPDTGYGYIRPGPEVPDTGADTVQSFEEKPAAPRAIELLDAGALWNAGIFLMRAATALAEIEAYAPAVAIAGRNAVTAGAGEAAALYLAPEPFLEAPAISFDHAVMEKTELAAVVEARFDWSDLGTWAAVFDAARKDVAGNVVSGDAVLIEAESSYVHTTRPKVGVVGVKDIVVVASDDAVLVTRREDAARVKALAGALAAAPEAVIGDFARHYRPWGHYQALELGLTHQVKRIVVAPGQRLSLQMHEHRAEHWTVVQGIADVTVGPAMEVLETHTLRPGDSIDIPKGAIHRVANPGDRPMTLIEVQLGNYLGEDDIVRLEDDYGR